MWASGTGAAVTARAECYSVVRRREAAQSAPCRRSGNDHSHASGGRRLADPALPARVRATRMRNLLRRSPRTGTPDAHACARGRRTGGRRPRSCRRRSRHTVSATAGPTTIAVRAAPCSACPRPSFGRLYADAAMIVNLHGGTRPLDEHVRGERLVLVQTDPVRLEIELHDWVPESHAFAGAHVAWFSFAELLGQPGCGLPVPPYPVRPTRQPVLLDMWSTAAESRETRGRPSGTGSRADGRSPSTAATYGWSKHDRWRRLPRSSGTDARTFHASAQSHR